MPRLDSTMRITSLSTIVLILLACSQHESTPESTVIQPEVAVIKTTIQPARWAAYERRANSTKPVKAEAEKELLAAFSTMNRAAVASDDPGSLDLHKASAAFELAAWKFTQRHTPKAYLQLGRRLGVKMIKRLKVVIGEARGKRLTVKQLLRDGGKSDAAKTYIDLAGTFAEHASQAGLIVNTTFPKAHQPLAQALFMENWAAPMRPRVAIDGWINRDEREWLLRWRVEYQSKGKTTNRLDALKELAKLPDYPAEFNGGVILVEARQFGPALQRFKKSKQPAAAAIVSWLEQRQKK